MAAWVKVRGEAGAVRTLRSRSLRGRVRMAADVVYDAPYAIYVHEDLSVRHRVGQAKFLEEPARRLARQLQQVIREVLLDKHSLEMGIRRAAGILLEASRRLVPVDTGRLRDSGRVEVR